MRGLVLKKIWLSKSFYYETKSVEGRKRDVKMVMGTSLSFCQSPFTQSLIHDTQTILDAFLEVCAGRGVYKRGTLWAEAHVGLMEVAVARVGVDVQQLPLKDALRAVLVLGALQGEVGERPHAEAADQVYFSLPDDQQPDARNHHCSARARGKLYQRAPTAAGGIRCASV